MSCFSVIILQRLEYSPRQALGIILLYIPDLKDLQVKNIKI